MVKKIDIRNCWQGGSAGYTHSPTNNLQQQQQQSGVVNQGMLPTQQQQYYTTGYPTQPTQNFGIQQQQQQQQQVVGSSSSSQYQNVGVQQQANTIFQMGQQILQLQQHQGQQLSAPASTTTISSAYATIPSGQHHHHQQQQQIITPQYSVPIMNNSTTAAAAAMMASPSPAYVVPTNISNPTNSMSTSASNYQANSASSQSYPMMTTAHSNSNAMSVANHQTIQQQQPLIGMDANYNPIMINSPPPSLGGAGGNTNNVHFASQIAGMIASSNTSLGNGAPPSGQSSNVAMLTGNLRPSKSSSGNIGMNSNCNPMIDVPLGLCGPATMVSSGSHSPMKTITLATGATIAAPSGLSAITAAGVGAPTMAILTEKIERAKKELQRQQQIMATVVQPVNNSNSSYNESTATNPVNSPKKSRKCGICQACLRDDCAKCKACLDKPKFGGPNKMRKKCIMKECTNMILPGRPDSNNVVSEPASATPKKDEEDDMSQFDVLHPPTYIVEAKKKEMSATTDKMMVMPATNGKKMPTTYSTSNGSQTSPSKKSLSTERVITISSQPTKAAAATLEAATPAQVTKVVKQSGKEATLTPAVKAVVKAPLKPATTTPAKPIDKTSTAYLSSLVTKPKARNLTTAKVTKKSTPKATVLKKIVIPSTFSPSHAYRATAAYSLLRTLSKELRLSPFTLQAFTNALMLPLPSKLLGQIHVRVFRLLFANGGMGRDWGVYSKYGDGGDEQIVRKKIRTTATANKLKSKKDKGDSSNGVAAIEETELIEKKGGNNLQYLDATTWPLFYQDYALATEDKLRDIMEEGGGGTDEDDEVNEEFISIKSEAMQPLEEIDLNPPMTRLQRLYNSKNRITSEKMEWVERCPVGPLGKRNAAGRFICCPFHVHSAMHMLHQEVGRPSTTNGGANKKRKRLVAKNVTKNNKGKQPAAKKTRGRGRPRKTYYDSSSSGSEFSAEDVDESDDDDDDFTSPSKKKPRKNIANSTGDGSAKKKRGRPRKAAASSPIARKVPATKFTPEEGRMLLKATPQAKIALQEVCLSVTRHPNGQMDPSCLQRALSHGLTKEVICKAAIIAREKDFHNTSKPVSQQDLVAAAAALNQQVGATIQKQRIELDGKQVKPFVLGGKLGGQRANQPATTRSSPMSKAERKNAYYSIPPSTAAEGNVASPSFKPVPNPLLGSVAPVESKTDDTIDLTADDDSPVDSVEHMRGGGGIVHQPHTTSTKRESLSAGWSQHIDKKSGTTFYFNKAIGKSTWVKPTAGQHQQLKPTYPRHLPVTVPKVPLPLHNANALVVTNEVATSIEIFLADGPSSLASCADTLPKDTNIVDQRLDLSDIRDGESSSANHLLSHMLSVEKLSNGIPYHTLSLDSKLSILEFLLDELLQTPEIAHLFSQRELAGETYNSLYGTEPMPHEFEEMYNADECTVCGIEGDLLCCDGCPGSYHRVCM